MLKYIRRLFGEDEITKHAKQTWMFSGYVLSANDANLSDSDLFAKASACATNRILKFRGETSKVEWDGTNEIAIILCSRLDSQVCNGGFHQFFWNTECKLNAEVREALAHCGLSQHLALYDKALESAGLANVAIVRSQAELKWEAMVESESFKSVDWEELDSTYYRVDPDMNAQIAAYIRGVLTEFTQAPKWAVRP